MGIAINRVTRQVILSASEGDYTGFSEFYFVGGKTQLAGEVEALIAAGVPSKYWVLGDTSVTEMDADAKAAVDVQHLALARLQWARDGAAAVTAFLESHYHETTQRSILMYMIGAQAQGLTNRLAYLASMTAWCDSVIAHYHARRAVAFAATDIATLVGTTLDLEQFVATNPSISLATARAITD